MKMSKKINIVLLASLLSLMFSSCASKDKLVMTEVTNTEDGVVKIDYSKGWVKKDSKNVDETYGNIRLRAKKNIGTFNISIVDDTGKTIPCFSTSNEYITTSFYLKAGNKVIKLNEDSCVDSAVRKMDKGMQILYSIQDVADVFITFECFEADSKSKLIDSVKITAHIVNTGKKKTEFQLKAIFDTILGETDRHHFYDSKNQPVKNEVSYSKFAADDWFVSKNQNASMQFIFAGAKDTTDPSFVAMANFATLDTKYWQPDMNTYRAFDTVLSYNNSAVGVIWKTRKIAPEESGNEIMYICTAYGKESPLGTKLIVEDKKSTSKNDEDLEDNKKDNQKSDNNQKNNVKENITDSQNSSVQKPVDAADITAVEQKEPEYSKEYIQSILDRIEVLKDNGDEVSEEEIRRLNQELDKILKSYRK